jgi:hypothetical protein
LTTVPGFIFSATPVGNCAIAHGAGITSSPMSEITFKADVDFLFMVQVCAKSIAPCGKANVCSSSEICEGRVNGSSYRCNVHEQMKKTTLNESMWRTTHVTAPLRDAIPNRHDCTPRVSHLHDGE